MDAHQVHLEGGIAVPPQAVIEAETQLLKGHAHMTSVVEPLLECDAVVPPLTVILLQSVQNLQLHCKATLTEHVHTTGISEHLEDAALCAQITVVR